MKTKIKLIPLIGILLMMGVSTMSQANELTFKESIELSQLKYGPDYLITTTIPVTITEKVKLTPDTAVFSVQLITQDNEAKTTFDKNAITMTKFRNYLTSINVVDKDLMTLDYKNYENWIDKPIKTTEKDRYRSTLNVSIILDNQKFFDAVNLLELYHIDVSQLKKSSSSYYQFTITETNDSANLAKSIVKERFDAIQQKLLAMDIKQIDISDYYNEVIKPPAKTERVKTYCVSNTLQIKLTNFNQLGKILVKLQDLGIRFNNDIHYQLSNSYQEQVMQQHQANMFKKMMIQADIYLGNNQNGYTLGNLISFNPNVVVPQQYNPNLKKMDYSAKMMENAMEVSQFDENQIIQAPSEQEVTLTMSGVFEILKKRYQP